MSTTPFIQCDSGRTMGQVCQHALGIVKEDIGMMEMDARKKKKAPQTISPQKREQWVPDLRLSNNVDVDGLEKVETASGLEMRKIRSQALTAHLLHWSHRIHAAHNNPPRNFGATTFSRLGVCICLFSSSHVALGTTQILCKSASPTLKPLSRCPPQLKPFPWSSVHFFRSEAVQHAALYQR